MKPATGLDCRVWSDCFGKPRPEPSPCLFPAALLENPVHGRSAHFQSERDFGDGLAVVLEPHNFARVAGCVRSATDPATCPRSLQPGNRPLTESDALLFCNHGEDRDDGLTKHAAGIKVTLGKAAVADAVLSEILQIAERFERAFPAESV